MRHRQLLFSLVAAVTLVVPPALPQSSTNGVYGGYVGSDRWFDDMRRYAANQAAMQNVAGTRQAETAARNLHELGQKLKQLAAQYKV